MDEPFLPTCMTTGNKQRNSSDFLSIMTLVTFLQFSIHSFGSYLKLEEKFSAKVSSYLAIQNMFREILGEKSSLGRGNRDP